jgi:hypothetical protein
LVDLNTNIGNSALDVAQSLNLVARGTSSDKVSLNQANKQNAAESDAIVVFVRPEIKEDRKLLAFILAGGSTRTSLPTEEEAKQAGGKVLYTALNIPLVPVLIEGGLISQGQAVICDVVRGVGAQKLGIFGPNAGNPQNVISTFLEQVLAYCKGRQQSTQQEQEIERRAPVEVKRKVIDQASGLSLTSPVGIKVGNSNFRSGLQALVQQTYPGLSVTKLSDADLMDRLYPAKAIASRLAIPDDVVPGHDFRRSSFGRRILQSLLKNNQFRAALEATGSDLLVGAPELGVYWGTNDEGIGQNWWGKLLMEARASLGGAGAPVGMYETQLRELKKMMAEVQEAYEDAVNQGEDQKKLTLTNRFRNLLLESKRLEDLLKKQFLSQEGMVKRGGQGAFADVKGLDEFQEVMGECSNEPTLSVMVIPHIRLRWYIAWNVLALASHRDIHTIIENEASRGAAKRKLQEPLSIYDPDGKKKFIIEVPRQYIDALYRASRLVMATPGSGLTWDDERFAHAKHMPLMGGQPPSFGRLSQVFGPAGSFNSIFSTFQHKRQFSAEAFTPEVHNLALLEEYYAASQMLTHERQTDKAYPAYVRVGLFKDKPKIAIVAGRLDDYTGMGLVRAGKNVPLTNTFMPVVAAMIAIGDSGEIKRPSSPTKLSQLSIEVCLDIPDLMFTGTPKKPREQTEGRKLESFVLFSKLSPAKPDAIVFSYLPVLQYKRGTGKSVMFSDPELSRIEILTQKNSKIIPSISFNVKRDPDYFQGNLPDVLVWAADYMSWLDKFPGIDRLSFHETLQQKGLLYPQYLNSARYTDLAGAYKQFSEIRDAAEEIGLDQRGRSQKLTPEELPALEQATILFVQDLRTLEESPTAGALVPAQIRVDTPEGPKVLLPDIHGLIPKHRAAFEEDPKKVLPPLTARVSLVDKNTAFEEMLRRAQELGTAREERNRITQSAVQELIKQRGIATDATNRFFVLIPRAWAEEIKTVPDVLVDEEEGQILPTVIQKSKKVWSAFQDHKRFILDVVARLMRLKVEVSERDGGSSRSFAFVGTENRAAPWVSMRLPYLLAKLPATVTCRVKNQSGDAKTISTTMLLGPGEAVPTGEGSFCQNAIEGDDGKLQISARPSYAGAFLQAFSFGRRSEFVKGGRMAVRAGLAQTGARGTEGRAKDPRKVVASSGFRKRGFYALVMETYELAQLTPPTGAGAQIDRQYIRLNIIMSRLWPRIVAVLKSMGKLPVDEMPAPPKIYEIGDVDEHTAPALEVMQAMLNDPERFGLRGIEGLFYEGTKLIHPAQNKLGLTRPHSYEVWDADEEDVIEEKTDTPWYHEDMMGDIYSIENPRRSRRPRYRERNNPLSEDQFALLKAAIKDGSPIPSTIWGDTRIRNYDQLNKAISGLFPRRSKSGGRPIRKQLTDDDRYEVLREADLITRGQRNVRKVPNFAENLSRGNKISAEIDALADKGDITFEDANLIWEQRLKNFEKGKVTTPSGALCMAYRNTTRLVNYMPGIVKADMKFAKKAYWIVVGKDKKERFRFMAVRNGTYVDCDILAPADDLAANALGSAIRQAVLWLGERAKRPGALVNGVNLAVVGRRRYRKLWVPKDVVDGDTMLRRAFGATDEFQLSGFDDDAAKADQTAFEAASADSRPYRTPSDL